MKYFYDLTNKEKMELYNHNSSIKRHADEMVEYVRENFLNSSSEDPSEAEDWAKDYSISDALEDIATNMAECPEDWVILVSGFETVEVYQQCDTSGKKYLKVEHYKEA